MPLLNGSIINIPVAGWKSFNVYSTLKKGIYQILNASFFSTISGHSTHRVLIVCRRGKFLQTGTQFLLQELLATAGHRGRCHGCCGRLHELVVTAEAGATAQGCRLQLDHLRRSVPGAGALPAGLAACVTHGEIALPSLSADAVADHAGPLQTVPTALGTIQRNLLVGPQDSAGEARAQLDAQVFDGEHGLGTDFQGGGRCRR